MKIVCFIFIFCVLNSFSQSTCIKTNMNYTGFCTEYSFSDSSLWIKEFENGNVIGLWMHFDKNGNLLQQLDAETKKDSLASIHFQLTVEQLAEMEPENDYFGEEDRHATFPGGSGAFQEFMMRNLKYPTDAIDYGLQGRCYLKFVIEKDGKVTNISVVRGVPDCPQCDKEGIRLLKSMPNWIPSVAEGKRVRTWMQVPLNFTLH